MIRKILYTCIIFSALLFFHEPVAAQDDPSKNDTFFLAKKKGLMGRFGKSISRTPPDEISSDQ